MAAKIHLVISPLTGGDPIYLCLVPIVAYSAVRNIHALFRERL
ncbi:MAG: hypothetical protein OXF56_08440 [Rhodobacteraceae bacterium]|nr:hypothetical protein [Paracoccaceae bacterium]